MGETPEEIVSPHLSLPPPLGELTPLSCRCIHRPIVSYPHPDRCILRTYTYIQAFTERVCNPHNPIVFHIKESPLHTLFTDCACPVHLSLVGQLMHIDTQWESTFVGSHFESIDLAWRQGGQVMLWASNAAHISSHSSCTRGTSLEGVPTNSAGSNLMSSS